MQRKLSHQLRLLLDSEGLGQDALASAVGVSQSTISRALARGYVRSSSARHKIESYLVNNASKLHKSAKLPLDVSQAFRRVWDKTDDHAQLIAKVIRALEGFGPTTKLKENVRKHREN